MSEGDGMAERLDELAGEHQHWCQADAHGDCCNGECDCGQVERRAAIAAALAEERAKARAPFLAALDVLEKSVKWQTGGMPRDMFDAERAKIAMEFRRAAEETL